jgi:hypothetical protein
MAPRLYVATHKAGLMRTVVETNTRETAQT